ncbi:MAG: hypothetical protein HYZ44_17840 [Bacteroidetes bacterium]|nr:hypothetical protein [Bacteroidota bacterium]
MAKENREPMVHFVNGTNGALTVRALPYTGSIFEGNWFNVPIDKIDFSYPITAHRTNFPDSTFLNLKLNRPNQDTVIIIGEKDFLKEIIVYTDNFPDTSGNAIYYHYETNYDKISYQKILDMSGNLASERLLIPKYFVKGQRATLNYALVPVGITRIYHNGTVHLDTIKFNGIENLPVRFKDNTKR